MTRPPLNAYVLYDGREVLVTEHTERGFKYVGDPHSICPRLGMNMTGEGEVFCDMESEGFRWEDHVTILPT